MKDEHMIYTGQLSYKEIDFTFVFDGKELRLIPPQDKMDEVSHWFRKPIADGAYVPYIPILEDDYLPGDCNETGQRIIFLAKNGSSIFTYGHPIFASSFVLSVNIVAYILCRYDYETIDRISFTNPEINAIHPVNAAVQFPLLDDFEKSKQSGVMSVTTKDFDSTTTEVQKFLVYDSAISVYFTVSRKASYKIGEPPLSLDSCLMFEFEPTNDYNFILQLWRIAKDFLSYLCYRRDVYLSTAQLAAPYGDGKHENFATLYVVGEEKDTDIETIRSGRYIKQRLIAGHEGQILTDIAAGDLYLRHLPESFVSGKNINAARFVMITAAFEWEFRRNYPTGIKKSETTQKAEDEVEKEIQKLLDNACGKKQKKIYKFLKKSVRLAPLQSEIKLVGEDYTEIINVIGESLYSLNNEKLVYSNMGQRLQNQRNHFAHGDLDEDFIDLSLLDLIFLQYIVYALQLKHYGIDNSKIQHAINDLFRCGLALPQEGI